MTRHEPRAGHRSAPFVPILALGFLCLSFDPSAAGRPGDPSAAGAEVGHTGPGVAPGTSGPARFVGPLYDAFDASRAMRDAAYADNWFRTPGGPAYNATLERLAERLKSVGFGADPRLKIEFLETEMERPAWIPQSASLIMRVGEGAPQVLQAFSHPYDRDRVMLPVHAPAADVEGQPVFDLGNVKVGTILVTEARVTRSLRRRAEKRGAVAVLSAALFPFTVDPTGAERHQDAILFTKVTPGELLPVAQISPRVHRHIREAAQADSDAWLALTAQVATGSSRLRTLCATIEGKTKPGEAVAIASHVQEPGAGDNASGIAGLAESAASLVDLLREEKLEWPDRTIVFLWGDEMKQSEIWLEQTERTPIAGISADMLGQSYAQTGAIALLERMQDPGALMTLEPDSHTPWGAGAVEEEDLHPNGLALIARTALADVSAHVGGWRTSENPWEGGSDHDKFLERGIPAVLLWHFTDFTYHTSLDRMEMLDPEELRRSCVTIMATAMAVAAAESGDLERYLASNDVERDLRVRVAEAAKAPEIARHWERWCDGAAEWLGEICK